MDITFEILEFIFDKEHKEYVLRHILFPQTTKIKSFSLIHSLQPTTKAQKF